MEIPNDNQRHSLPSTVLDQKIIRRFDGAGAKYRQHKQIGKGDPIGECGEQFSQIRHQHQPPDYSECWDLRLARGKVLDDFPRPALVVGDFRLDRVRSHGEPARVPGENVQGRIVDARGQLKSAFIGEFHCHRFDSTWREGQKANVGRAGNAVQRLVNGRVESDVFGVGDQAHWPAVKFDIDEG